MSDAARVEIDLHENAILPARNPEVTPFAEMSRLMMIGIDANQQNNLLWTAQTEPNGPWSGTWDVINKTSYIVLATGSTTDGRVALAAQTKSSPLAVHYIDEAAQGAGGEERWNEPISLGMPEGLAGFVQLEMVRDADGRIEIFGVDDSGGNVWWIYQNPPKIVDKTEQVTPPGSTTPITVHVQEAEPPDTPWSAWIALPGQTVSRLTVSNDATGRITLIGTGQNPKAVEVYVISQSKGTSLATADWSGWTRIDNANSGTAGSRPTAVLDNEGAINIFMVGSQADVVQIRQQLSGGPGWSEWYRPGMTGKALVNVTSAFAGNGQIVLVALDENLGLHANYQYDALFQQWSGWQQIGVAPDFGLTAMDYNADGSLAYFQGETKINGVKMISQATMDSTSWTAGWTMLADNGIFTYGIVRDLTPPETS
tara:strand:+ start:10384 stop:11661 length:1278 start_codon:yes stop_codon:yes gene_type:complete